MPYTKTHKNMILSRYIVKLKLGVHSRLMLVPDKTNGSRKTP